MGDGSGDNPMGDSGSRTHHPGHRRYWADAVDPDAGRVWIGPEEARHVLRVMRHRPGDRIEVIDGSGRCYEVAIEETAKPAKSGLTARILGIDEPSLEIELPWLVQAVIRPERLEMVIDGAVQLGVAGIVLLRAARSPGLQPRRLERFVRLMRAATAQSLGIRLPELAGPLPLPGLLSKLAGHRLWVAHGPRAREASGDRFAGRWLEGIANEPPGAEPVLRAEPGGDPSSVLRHALVVGPEGGFAEEELAELTAAGALLVDLGPRRLRSETAALAGLALLGQHLRRTGSHPPLR
jgi:16S rRNA (uracil1498-N3)-methyltransferase